MTRRAITEYLAIDLDARRWACRRCETLLGPASESYKKGCLIAARDPSEIWQPLIDERYTFSFDRAWARVVETYCPQCATLFDVELLPPGHPQTDDIAPDLDALVARDAAEKTARAEDTATATDDVRANR
jgi:acetone carboxylase gamma subunit